MARMLANLIAPLFVSTLRCPGCGFEQDAVNHWSIGGFTPARAQHVMRVRDPYSKAWIGHTPCPQCGVSIRIR